MLINNNKLSFFVIFLLFFNISAKGQSFLKGNLQINTSFEYFLKDYKIKSNKKTNTFSICRNKIKLEISKISFIQAASGKEIVTEERGSFFIDDKLDVEYKNQTIDTSFKINKDSIIILGTLKNKESTIPYKFCLKIKQNNSLYFTLKVNKRKINRIFITFSSEKEENFYGMGEQFTHLNLNGHYVPSFISEQGIGRGKQPLTFLVNLVAKSGGTEFTTYAAMPFFFSSKKYSVSLENSQYSAFDFRKKDLWQIRCFSKKLKGHIYINDNFKLIITQNAKQNGLMRNLPDWFHKGAIIGIQGGTEKVSEIYDSLKKYNTPVSGLWLQDWVGQRTTSFGKQLWWNWQLDSCHYKNWFDLNKKLKSDSVNTLVYINPFLVDVSDNPNHSKNLFKIAEENNYLVKNSNGETYLIPNTDFSAAIIDLSNPEAIKWFKKIIKQNVITTKAMGWMADFGEALPYDAVLYSSESAAKFHNKYPVEWVKLNRQVIDNLPNGKEYVFFSRAAFSGSSAYSTLFWEGDQLVSWDKNDGIKSAVIGLLSSGLSGMPFNHSDIGGYTGINNPLAKNIRSKELLWRWIELNAFSPVFRTHQGNLPDKNYQIYDDAETMRHFSKYANIFASLFNYRKKLFKQAANTGMPVVRPMFLEFSDDDICYKIEYEQFMFGSDFLIAPILDKNKRNKKVYLPKGIWINLWNGKKIKSNGEYFKFKVKIGEILVFYKNNSVFGDNLYKKIMKMNY